MLNIVSIIIGLSSLIFVIPGIMPLLGWVNWIGIPILVVGLIVGVLSRKTTGRNLNLVLLIVAVVRLSLGGGIF